MKCDNKQDFEQSSKFSAFPKVNIGGFQTISCTRAELADMMVQDCKDRSGRAYPKLVFSSNGQGISLAAADPSFMKVMDQADIIHADGMSVVTASRLLTDTPLPERICTTDFFVDAAEAAVHANLSFFFLGGSEEQNKAAVERVRQLFPGLRIAGRRNGYFSADENDAVCNSIREGGTDVLWVALGKPLQERWSLDNRGKLESVGWVKTCGGLYGYLAGTETRAPLWVQEYGLEWLYRLIRSPRRLLWRYIVTNPHALWQMIKQS